ncbi:hypothetical protein D3C81_1115620 [compost metagenome]
MTDWRKAYVGLAKAGYTDEQIAELAGVTRAVINGVRNGTWPYPHEPKHSGGQRILHYVDEAIRHGLLEEDPLK